MGVPCGRTWGAVRIPTPSGWVTLCRVASGLQRVWRASPLPGSREPVLRAVRLPQAKRRVTPRRGRRAKWLRLPSGRQLPRSVSGVSRGTSAPVAQCPADRERTLPMACCLPGRWRAASCRSHRVSWGIASLGCWLPGEGLAVPSPLEDLAAPTLGRAGAAYRFLITCAGDRGGARRRRNGARSQTFDEVRRDGPGRLQVSLVTGRAGGRRGRRRGPGPLSS